MSREISSVEQHLGDRGGPPDRAEPRQEPAPRRQAAAASRRRTPRPPDRGQPSDVLKAPGRSSPGRFPFADYSAVNGRITRAFTPMCAPHIAVRRYYGRWAIPRAALEAARRVTMGQSAASSRDFVRAAMRAPYLERDEEHDLAVRWQDDQGPGGPPSADRRAHAAGHRHRRALPQFRPADGRPDPGGPRRPSRGRGPLRAGTRGPLLDLRHVVDPRLDPGLHPAQLVDRARRHVVVAEGAVLQPAAPARTAGAEHRPASAHS